MDNNPIYRAIVDSVELNGTINTLKTAAEEKLLTALEYGSALSSSDNREEKLRQMNEALALNKFLKLINYIEGKGVPATVLDNYEKHLDYILSVLR